MHPHPAFRWADEAAMRAFVRTRALALIAVAVESRVRAAHAPLSAHDDGSVRFHLALGNPLVPLLDGAAVLATVTEDAGYISPDWYGTPDQVATWNYRLVEIEGVARRLDAGETRDQLDRLSAVHEASLAPKPAWTMDKMSPARRNALLRGIVGFAIDGAVLRGVAKLGQNKSAAEAAGAIAALHALGRHDAAAAMAEVRA